MKVKISRRDLLVAVAGASIARPQTASPRIRVGCQTRAYGSPIRDRAQLLSALDDLAVTGYAGFETNFASLEPSFDDPAPMRAEIEKRHLQLIGLHGTVNFISPANLEKDRAQFDRLAKASKGLGAEMLILSSSNGVPRDSDGRVDGAALKLRCEELNRAGAICGTLGLRLAIHNHANETANNGEELEAILERTEPRNVSVLMDLAYVNGAHINVPAFFRKHYRRTAGLHVRDQRDGKEVNLGEGNLDLKGMAEALRDTHWSGWVILEVNKRADISSRQLVETSRKFMRDVMKI
jgi:inosose dehydratase